MTTYAYTGVLQGSTKTLNMWVGVATDATNLLMWVYAPNSHSICYSFAASATLTTTTDAMCVHASTTAISKIGDYYGVATAGTLTADTADSWTTPVTSAIAW